MKRTANRRYTKTAKANSVPLTGSTGTLAIGLLATGTPDGTKFIRDDGTLQTVAAFNAGIDNNFTVDQTMTGIIGGDTNLTIKGKAGVGAADGEVVNITGGDSGSGATGNGAALTLRGGSAASTNGSGGNLVLTGGLKTGSGSNGQIQLGTSLSSSISIGASGITTNIDGTLTLQTDLAIADGGTGAGTATAAFDNLAPTTTQGDIIYHNGTDNVRLAAGTSGYVLKTLGAGANPAWALPEDASTQTSHVNGGGSLEIWCTAPVSGCPALTANNHATGTLRLMPFQAPARGGTIDRVGFNITTAGGAGNTIRFGIYDSTSATNLYPNALLAESAAVSVNGVTGLQTITVSIALTPGRVYWLALSTSFTATMRGGTATTCSTFLGYTNAAGTAQTTHLTVAHVHGALPNPCTAGAAVASGNHPVGFYRFSA